MYTKKNCGIECIANYTLFKCGCAKFHMPRDRTTRICNVNDMKCYLAAEFSMTSMEIEQKLDLDDPKSPDHNCNCMPVCNSLLYEADVTGASFNFKEYIRAKKLPWDISAK